MQDNPQALGAAPFIKGDSRLDILRRVGGRHAALYEPLQAMEQQTHTSPNSLDFGHPSYRVGLSRPLECGGKRSATPLLIVGGAETRPQSVSCGMEPKAPSSLRSAGALQNALTRPSKMSKLQGRAAARPYPFSVVQASSGTRIFGST